MVVGEAACRLSVAVSNSALWPRQRRRPVGLEWIAWAGVDIAHDTAVGQDQAVTELDVDISCDAKSRPGMKDVSKWPFGRTTNPWTPDRSA